MQQLKAANPGVKVLMYKNLSGMTERPRGFVSGGVAPQTPPRTPSGTCSTRAASGSPRATTTGSGSPTSAAPPTSSDGPTTCSARSPRTAGTASSWTTPTRHVLALRRQPDGQVPHRRGVAGGDRARRWSRSARASAPRASSSSPTSPTGSPSPPWSRTGSSWSTAA